MLRPILIGLLVGLGLLIVLDHSRSAKPGPAAAVQASVQSQPAGTQAPQRATVGPLPNAMVSGPAAPTLDLGARLAIRRRIEREGTRVYLDSLLSHTDSSIVHWGERPGNVLTVAFVSDTGDRNWSEAMADDARAGMREWEGNESGLSFREIADPDSADIRVHWTPSLSEPGQLGVTGLNWSPDGVAHSAEITLAIHRANDSLPLPSDVRRRVAVHEFGHALGLPHSGSDVDVMFHTSPTDAPSRRDRSTLLLLYALPTGSLKIPQ